MTSGRAAFDGLFAAPAEAVELPRLVVRVLGECVPQGSHTARMINGRPVVMWSNSAALRKWRKLVIDSARQAARVAGWVRTDGPVTVHAEFYLERPPSAPRRRIYPDRKPDTDRLIRGIGDALEQAGVVVQDSRITDWHACKRYARPGQPLGVRIVVINGVEEASA